MQFEDVWLLLSPLVAFVGIYLLVRFIFPAYMYSGIDRDESMAGQTVAVGEPLAVVSCGGVIGSIRFSGPLLKVQLFAGGLSIKPLFMDVVELPLSCLHDITARRFWLTNGIEIGHVCSGVPKLVLYVDQASDFAVALAELTGAGLLAQQGHRAERQKVDC